MQVLLQCLIWLNFFSELFESNLARYDPAIGQVWTVFEFK